MAQKIHVELIDDLDGSAADETVPFGLDGRTYEIDLSTTNAQALRKGFEEYIKAGRKVSKNGNPQSARLQAAVTQFSHSNREIRDWARSNGYEMPERGRIPGEIRTAFEAAKS